MIYIYIKKKPRHCNSNSLKDLLPHLPVPPAVAAVGLPEGPPRGRQLLPPLPAAELVGVLEDEVQPEGEGQGQDGVGGHEGGHAADAATHGHVHGAHGRAQPGGGSGGGEGGGRGGGVAGGGGIVVSAVPEHVQHGGHDHDHADALEADADLDRVEALVGARVVELAPVQVAVQLRDFENKSLNKKMEI